MKNFLISIKITFAFSVILFVGYVLVLWGVAALAAPNGGRAQVVTVDGKTVGAANVGQSFSGATYFWSRPSAVDYNGSGSGGSNLSVSNPDYLQEVEARIDHFMESHPYLKREEVPSEMVTASGSGLDPHVSVGAAMVQVSRVADARGLSVDEVTKVVESVVEDPFVGPSFVNVLKLNVALDEQFKR